MYVMKSELDLLCDNLSNPTTHTVGLNRFYSTTKVGRSGSMPHGNVLLLVAYETLIGLQS